jgi:hypothetical protein
MRGEKNALDFRRYLLCGGVIFQLTVKFPQVFAVFAKISSKRQSSVDEGGFKENVLYLTLI